MESNKKEMPIVLIKLRPTSRLLYENKNQFRKVMKNERLLFEVNDYNEKTGKIVSHDDVLWAYMPEIWDSKIHHVRVDRLLTATK
jgi:hypothetical protein